MNAPALSKRSSISQPRRLYGAFQSERNLSSADKARPEAGSSFAASYDPGEVKAELASLCRRYGARHISTWTMNPSTNREPVVATVDESEVLHPAWTADVEDNSEVALRTRNRTTRTIDTEPALVVVSQVLPYDNSQVVSFVFPKSHLVDNVELLHEGLDHATARVAIVALRKELHRQG